MSAWLDISGTGLCVVDDMSRVVVLNAAACNILNVRALAVLNRPLKTLFEAVKGAPSLIQWLGAPGFDGEKHVTKTDENGTVDLVLRAVTLRAESGKGTAERFKVISIADVTCLRAAQRLIESGAIRRQMREGTSSRSNDDQARPHNDV